MEEEKEKIMNENVEDNRLGEGKEANFSALGLARPEVSLCLTNWVCLLISSSLSSNLFSDKF